MLFVIFGELQIACLNPLFEITTIYSILRYVIATIWGFVKAIK